MSLDQPVKAFGGSCIDRWKVTVLHWQVNDCIAAAAHKMIVRTGIVIEMVNTQNPKTVPGNHAGLRKLVQVAVHGAKTDIWKLLLNTGID